jgi:hypothetical protein
MYTPNIGNILQRNDIIMYIAKKRVIALVSAFILLFTAAVLPIGKTQTNPFGAMKVSAVDTWDFDTGNITAFLSRASSVVVATNNAGGVDTVTFNGIEAPFEITFSLVGDMAMNGNNVTGAVNLHVVDSGGPSGDVTKDIAGTFDVDFTNWLPAAGSGTFTFTATGTEVTIGSISSDTATHPTYTVSNLSVTQYPACTVEYYVDGTLAQTNNSNTSTGRVTEYIPTLAEYQELDGWYISQEACDAGGTPNYDVNNKNTGWYITDWAMFTSATLYAKTVYRYPVTVTGGTADVAKAEEGATVTLTPTVPSGKQLIGWTSSPTVTFTGNTFIMPASPVAITATFQDIPPVTPDYSGSGSSGSNTAPSIPEITKPTGTTTTPEATTETPAPAPTATPAADVKVDETPAEDGKITLTVGDTKVETASTSAATVIAAGEASEVITSGNAVAVVTTDNAVIAGANASGSMNSTTTVAALTAAAANLEADETEVVIAAGEDVTVVSAATIRKLAAAAEEAGVTATLTAAATDETGVEVATIDIPLSAKTKTSIKTGLILVDESIDAAVASLEASSGNTVLASIKTEQKTSFGVKVAFSFDTAALGLDDAADGDTYYVAIKRGDGKTVQVKATIVGGKLVYTTASAGVMMISKTSFTK